jgi:two-component system sensor histidine kinase KdpD
MRSARTWSHATLPYVGAVVAVALASVVVELLGSLRLTTGSMLYLAAVLLVALTLGRGPAVFAAVVAALTFDFFFVEPRLNLRVASPDEWLVLVTFLLVGVVVSQLVAGQHRRAEEAEARRREALLLHDVGEQLAHQPFEHGLRGVAERIRVELDAAAVAVEVAEPGGTATSLVVGDQQAWRRAAGSPYDLLAEDAGAPRRWLRVTPPRADRTHHRDHLVRAQIRSGQARIGEISLVNPDRQRATSTAGARLLATATAQIAMAFEREQLRGEATEAELLRRTSDLKSALLNAVSHDLRTPLAAIIAGAGSLQQTDVDWSARDRAEFAENIEQEAARLNRIVGNVLDLGRIEGGALRPARDWHDATLLLSDSVERMRAWAGTIRLVLDAPADMPPVLLDPIEVDQVVTNLLENAVQHAPPDTPVTLTARRDDEGLRVSVDDCGRGIPPTALPRIFEPFYRSPSDSGSAGSGIGLAVARGLIAAHGGRIWAENREGGGARFTFVIPSPQPPAAADLR